MLSRLFIAALWSPERKRADLLARVCDVYCDFVTFAFGILEQMLYLIVPILIIAVFLTFYPSLDIRLIS